MFVIRVQEMALPTRTCWVLPVRKLSSRWISVGLTNMQRSLSAMRCGWVVLKALLKSHRHICVKGLQNVRLDSPLPPPPPPPILFILITHHHPTALLSHHPSPHPPDHHHLNCSETQSITQMYLLQPPVIAARTIQFDCGPSTLKKTVNREDSGVGLLLVKIFTEVTK